MPVTTTLRAAPLPKGGTSPSASPFFAAQSICRLERTTRLLGGCGCNGWRRVAETAAKHKFFTDFVDAIWSTNILSNLFTISLILITHLKVNYFALSCHTGDGNRTNYAAVPPFSTTQINVRRMAFRAKSNWNYRECWDIFPINQRLISWCGTTSLYPRGWQSALRFSAQKLGLMSENET